MSLYRRETRYEVFQVYHTTLIFAAHRMLIDHPGSVRTQESVMNGSDHIRNEMSLNMEIHYGPLRQRVAFLIVSLAVPASVYVG